ncbi:hypothetical protein LSH36_700g00013 [Paralvinella palmiformis]|uniref:Uncharacterized protein n=1 Tax=Paralvinella palmiformis TaxID=53620 RepID=A0AAD9J2J2_9ANNE|nr:hypothetical protein LSH36_700g00013 [Paralvinella palmiformis]
MYEQRHSAAGWYEKHKDESQDDDRRSGEDPVEFRPHDHRVPVDGQGDHVTDGVAVPGEVDHSVDVHQGGAELPLPVVIDAQEEDVPQEYDYYLHDGRADDEDVLPVS